MIQVDRLIARIRYKNKDFNATQFSDYDLLQCINECLRYINQSYAIKNTDFLEARFEIKQADVDENICEDGVLLPEDYMRVLQVTDGIGRFHYAPTYARPKCNEYRISEGKIFVPRDATLFYHKKIAEVRSEKDSIDLPDILFEPIVKLCGMILNNAENDVMLQTVDDTVKAVVAGRKFSNARGVMPFKV